MDRQKIFFHLLNTFTTLAVAWLVFSQTVRTAEGDTIAVTFERISSLEQQVDDLRAELARYSAKNIELQMEAQATVNYVDVLQGMMDGMPVPGWIKQVEISDSGDVQFRMMVLNRAYEEVSKISRFRYLGQTDFDVFPPDLAQSYYDGDAEIWRDKLPREYRERAQLPSGDVVERIVVKYLVPLPLGKWGIAGVILELKQGSVLTLGPVRLKPIPVPEREWLRNHSRAMHVGRAVPRPALRFEATEGVGERITGFQR